MEGGSSLTQRPYQDEANEDGRRTSGGAAWCGGIAQVPPAAVDLMHAAAHFIVTIRIAAAEKFKIVVVKPQQLLL